MLITEIVRKHKNTRDKIIIQQNCLISRPPKPHEKAGTYINIETLINLINKLPNDELLVSESNGQVSIALPKQVKL